MGGKRAPAAKSKAARASKTNGKAPKRTPGPSKAGKKKGKDLRYCRACGEFKPNDEFPLTHNWCEPCKKAMNNLTNFAKRQGQDDWWKECQQCESRFQTVVATYKKRCPDTGTGGRRGTFSLAEYKEEFETSTEILKDDVGEMMNEEEFMDYCKTCKGGKLTTAAAALKWLTMKDNKKEYISDYKHGELRFRVSVKDVVTFRNAYKRSKKIELKNKGVKNPNEDQIDKMMNDIQKGHDNMMCDMEDMAKNMVLSGGQA